MQNSGRNLDSKDDITCAHFGGSACKGDYAVATNAMNDDLQHPIESEDITLYNVENDHKIVVKINSIDCVDMDCDGMKKAMFKDMEGRFLGHVGSVISESEFEWDTNSVRGLGDYRIPKEMVTHLDGNRIPEKDIVPYKGYVSGVQQENGIAKIWHVVLSDYDGQSMQPLRISQWRRPHYRSRTSKGPSVRMTETPWDHDLLLGGTKLAVYLTEGFDEFEFNRDGYRVSIIATGSVHEPDLQSTTNKKRKT